MTANTTLNGVLNQLGALATEHEGEDCVFLVGDQVRALLDEALNDKETPMATGVVNIPLQNGIVNRTPRSFFADFSIYAIEELAPDQIMICQILTQGKEKG